MSAQHQEVKLQRLLQGQIEQPYLLRLADCSTLLEERNCSQTSDHVPCLSDRQWPSVGLKFEVCLVELEDGDGIYVA